MSNKEIFAAVEAAYKQKYPTDLTNYRSAYYKECPRGSFVLSKYTRTSKDYIDTHDEYVLCPTA